MNKRILVQITIVFFTANFVFGQSNIKTDTFSFVFEGKKFYGFLDLPEDKPKAIVIIVPGYGKTNFGEGGWYFDSLRRNFGKIGLASFLWDKAGCGKSEGVYDPNQPIENSAKEVLTAIKELKRRNISGSDRIGLWGISRAGWICPLVIQQNPLISFWISISGTDDKENFGYLLESNFRIEGRTEKQTQLLVSEWQNGNDIFRKGGSFEEYQKATQNLRQDSFWLSVSGDQYTEEGYLRIQKNFISEHHEFDEATGLMIYVHGFKDILNTIQCPVLAIFGDKDANVDWQKTKALYEETIGNKNDQLTIKIMEDCNHSIIKCKTGGIHEKMDIWEPCDDYFETMTIWLKQIIK